jgi:endonuclease/exonuclease/phosphatase family metal-dependent hydrolase
VRSAAADLVLLQEAITPAVVQHVAKAAGLPYCASSRGRSLAFMSRLPVKHYEWHQPRFSRHAFLEIVLPDECCRIFGLHLSAVHSAWTERRRMFELRALLASIARHQHGFHVLTGDFNTLAPGEMLERRLLPARLRALVWLSGGRIRWRTIQHVLNSGYLDAFRTLHPEVAGLTFPTWNPHIRLDYAFLPAAFRDRLQSCQVIDTPEARSASDHLPLLTEVTIDAPGSTRPETGALSIIPESDSERVGVSDTSAHRLP